MTEFEEFISILLEHEFEDLFDRLRKAGKSQQEAQVLANQILREEGQAWFDTPGNRRGGPDVPDPPTAESVNLEPWL